MGKLTGVRVVDLSQFLPGPMMSVMMADQGAEVIKVEPAAGDPARDQAPFDTYGDAEHSVWFANLNRGKKSVVLDLKAEDGKAALGARRSPGAAGTPRPAALTRAARSCSPGVNRGAANVPTRSPPHHWGRKGARQAAAGGNPGAD